MTLTKVMQFGLGPLASALIALILIPIMAWIYPVEDIGRYGLLQVIVSFLAMVMTLGLDQAYVREYHEVKDRRALLAECLLPGMLLLILIVLIAGCFNYMELLNSNLLEYDSPLLEYLIITCVLFMFISRFLGLILRMQERGLAYSASQMLPKAAFLIMLIAVFLIKDNNDFIFLVLCFTLSMMLVTVILMINVRSELASISYAAADPKRVKFMLKYSIALLASNILYWALISIDKVFIKTLSNLEEVGLYSMAINFAGAALIFQMVFSTVWAPIVYKWASEGLDADKLNKVVKYATIAVCFIWVSTGILSPVITFILPSDYSDVQFLIVAVIAHPLLYLLSEASSVGIGVTRRSYLALLTSVIAVIVNALGNWFLVPVYGAAGAASSLAFSFFVFFILKTEFSRYAWGAGNMVKAYLFTAFLVLTSMIINIGPWSGSQGYYFYWVLLILLILFYKSDLRDIFVYINARVIKKV
jgi:O-antigen/teichoic acid export membrane protein